MPAYVAIFALDKDNNQENYKTLLSIIEPLLPGPVFFASESAVPLAVFFHSGDSTQKLIDRMKEHLYQGDQLVVLKISEGIADMTDQRAIAEFRQFLSGL